jgi:hypothetical protein
MNEVRRIPRSEWQLSIDQRDNNAKSSRHDARHNVGCHLCGRKMSAKAQENAHLVHMSVDGDLVETDAEITDSQGFFPVGSECAKRLPKGFVRKPFVRGV